MRGHFLQPLFVFDLLSVFDDFDDAAAASDGGLHVIGNRPVVFKRRCLLDGGWLPVAVIAESIGRDWRQKSTAQ